MPVGNGGKFTPEAREIYSLVLEMQKVGVVAPTEVFLLIFYSKAIV